MRSQMAPAILNHDLAGRFRSLSAGTHPQPQVADEAIRALERAGLPAAGPYPRDIDAVIDEPIDLVVTVCDSARESCPRLPHPALRMHLSFRDPHGEALESFTKGRDEIRERLLPAVLESLES